MVIAARCIRARIPSGEREVHSPGSVIVYLNGGVLGLHKRPKAFP